MQTHIAVCLLCTFVPPFLTAQTGTVERIKIHGKSLEGNLSADSPDRDVSIYLPPSYKTQPNRRYPVVYFLHGFTDSDDKWYGFTKHWINLPEVINKAIAAGAKEMIVVTPNAYTRFAGSMYSNSVTTGNWEEYVGREIVAYIDSHYRTLPARESRGLAGHSMGGYGTLRIGMKYPDVFSSIYALNPCCLATNLSRPPAKAETIRTDEDFQKTDFMTKAMLASGAAWSPNPQTPPFFMDLPSKDGQLQPDIAAKWAANAPLSFVDQYIYNLKRLRAIGFDAGTQEPTIAPTSKSLDEILTRYGIAHTFEIYEGNHTNRVAERIETKMLPFFSTNLASKP